MPGQLNFFAARRRNVVRTGSAMEQLADGRHGNSGSRGRCSTRRRLARLKFFFQSFVKLRHLLVSLRLELFSQLPLDRTSLLEIARLELVSRVLIQMKTRLTQSRFSFVF